MRFSAINCPWLLCPWDEIQCHQLSRIIVSMRWDSVPSTVQDYCVQCWFLTNLLLTPCGPLEVADDEIQQSCSPWLPPSATCRWHHGGNHTGCLQTSTFSPSDRKYLVNRSIHTVTWLLLQLLALLLMKTHSTTISAAADENTQYNY